MKKIFRPALGAALIALTALAISLQFIPDPISVLDNMGTVEGCTMVSEQAALLPEAFHNKVPLYEFLNNNNNFLEEQFWKNFSVGFYKTEESQRDATQEQIQKRVFEYANQIFSECMDVVYD